MMLNAVTKARRVQFRGLLTLFFLTVLAVNAPCQATHFECTKRIDINDLKLLLNNVAATNPTLIEGLKSDPELRLQQVLSLRQLLAFACEAVKQGALQDPLNHQELDNIQNEITAVNFDKITNKKTGQPLFSTITTDRVADFYRVEINEAKFDEFLKTKVGLLKRRPEMADCGKSWPLAQMARTGQRKRRVRQDQHIRRR